MENEKMENETTVNDKIAAIFKVTIAWDILAKYHSDEYWSHVEDSHYGVAGKHEAIASAYASCSGQLKELLKLWGTPQPIV